LPIEKKLNLVGDIIKDARDGNSFINPGRLNAYKVLNIVYNYTDIVFTDNQKKNPDKLYDAMYTSGFLKKVVSLIPVEELTIIDKMADETIKNIYDYQNSIKGIIADVTTDYSNLNLEASEIQQKLADPNNLKLLKGVMAELG
jgi:hypothetical protein